MSWADGVARSAAVDGSLSYDAVDADATLLLCPRWLVTMTDRDDGATRSRRWLEDHAVVLRHGRVLDVLPTEAGVRAYADSVSARVLHLPHHVVMPGLINAHTHAGMSLLRGCGDDQPLHKWLAGTIWPVEHALVDEAFVRDGTLLAVAEMIRSGCTTLNDMYWFPEETVRVCLEVGMRAVIGMIHIEFASRYAKGPREYLQRGEAMLQAFADHPQVATRVYTAEADRARPVPLVHFAYAPHAPYTVSEDALVEIVQRAARNGRRVHMHLHETAEEVRASRALDRSSSVCHQSVHAGTPLQNLQRLRLLGPQWIAVHAVHLSDEEIRLVAETGASVVHCPSSNLKLASGFCPVPQLLRAGVNVALGTDSAASNNKLDMFSEMRLAALLGKAVAGDAVAVDAATALRMATVNGARALALEHCLGSVAPGMAADLVAVRLEGQMESAPTYDVPSSLVYAASREQVTHVWVGGRCLLRDRQLLTIDESALLARVRYQAQRVASLSEGAPAS